MNFHLTFGRNATYFLLNGNHAGLIYAMGGRRASSLQLFAQESMEIFHIKTSPVATLKFMAAPEKSLSL